MPREIIAVFGGTGTIGHDLIPSLCKRLAEITVDDNSDPHIVRVLTRDATRAREAFAYLDLYDPTGVVVIELIEGAVEEPNSLDPLLQSATRLFLLTLTSLYQRQCAVEGAILSQLGLNAGADSKVGSSIRHIVRLSAHARVMEGQPSNSPFRWHSDCDEQLMRMCDRHRGCIREVGITILRPSLFMQDMTRRQFAPVISKESNFYQLGKVKLSTPSTISDVSNTHAGTPAVEFEDSYRIAMVDSRDIADVAACCLAEPIDKHANNTYILSGPNALLWSDVATAISNACGRKVTATMLSDADFYHRFGNSHVYLKQMQAYRSGCGEDVDNDIEIVTGRPARSITQFARDHAHFWQIEEK